MTFDHHIKTLNTILSERQPLNFSPSWIYQNTPQVYRYIQKHIRTENNNIDWDTVTSKLDRSFQKCWLRYRYKSPKTYENASEVDNIINKYKDKLYTFLSPRSDEDKQLQQTMIISLVRISQKGNLCAREEIVKWVTFITDDWIDRYPQMYCWKGYPDEVPDKIRTCIRCYRYTGSFLGYLFRTLEYSAYRKPPLVSLNDTLFDGSKTREEYVIADEDGWIYG